MLSCKQMSVNVSNKILFMDSETWISCNFNCEMQFKKIVSQSKPGLVVLNL